RKLDLRAWHARSCDRTRISIRQPDMVRTFYGYRNRIRCFVLDSRNVVHGETPYRTVNGFNFRRVILVDEFKPVLYGTGNDGRVDDIGECTKHMAAELVTDDAIQNRSGNRTCRAIRKITSVEVAHGHID